MKAAPDIGTVIHTIDRLRRNRTESSTNLFSSPDEISAWFHSNVAKWHENSGSVIITTREKYCNRIHYVASDLDALKHLLVEATSQPLETPCLPWISDLVGSNIALQPVLTAFCQAGFKNYKKLFRMTRLGSIPVEPPDDIEIAMLQDRETIFSFLEGLLDPYAERIPEPEAYTNAFNADTVLRANVNGNLGGVLIYELLGKTAILRYWFIRPEMRNSGIGSRLMRAFLHNCRHTTRILLWVLADNQDAIAKYIHYGFARDRLEDLIVVKGDR